MSEIDLKNKTEESFYNFFKIENRDIKKISSPNSPDFIVDNFYIFEVKAFNISGTMKYSKGIYGQKINVTNVLNKYIIDFDNKIINYKKINKNEKIDFFSLVIYDLRYPTWEHTIQAFKNSKIKKYSNIDCLIYAGYNQSSNLTLGLRIFKNPVSTRNIDKSIFKYTNFNII